MLKDVHDSLAEKLEATGMWRRAAARWLALMNRVEYTDAQRNWISQRRAYCQSMITPVPLETEPLGIAKFNKAMDATQERMGLRRTAREALRTSLYTDKTKGR